MKKPDTKSSKKPSYTKKPKIKIENVVASASVDAEIDLDKVAATLANAEYEPEQFPGLVLRLTEPKAAILVFSSGKMVCTGAKNTETITVAINKTMEQIRSAGIKIKGKATITVQNIVASSDLGTELNLDKVAFSLQNAEFEPEQFPGLVFRVFDPKVVFLLFRSGKIVCTGAKKSADVDRGVAKLIEELKRIKVL
jgi:transcription initiation factor TFIID TATA-box-binding protein